MRTARLIALAGILAIAAALHVSRPGASPPDTTVPLEVIRYDELGDRVVALRDRVVVVDFWADYCHPCKREFPHVVALHRKHAKSGLTVLSVNLDDAEDTAIRERVQKFLAEQEARFPNFVLAEKPETWQAKLKINGPPCIFVFDRRGRLVKKYHDGVDFADIERLVVDLLK